MKMPIPRARWWLWGAVLLLMALGGLGASHPKTVRWDRIEVFLRVNPDGTLDVEERWTLTFEGGPFRRGARRIERRYLVDVDGFAVADEQGPYRMAQEETPGTFWVQEDEDGWVVRWYFGPVSDVTRTFTLRYRVYGALRFYPNGEQLWWRAIPSDRNAPLQEAVVTVQVPGEVRAYRAYFVPARAERLDARTVRFVAETAIPPETTMEVRVEWPAGVVAGTPAPWQAEADAEDRARERQEAWNQTWRPLVEVLVFMASLGLLTVGSLAVLLLWYTRGRDPQTEVFAEYLPEPPSDLPPALVGVVVDEEADAKEVMATLLDLARRGFLTVEDRGNDFVFRITDPSVPLASFERVLVEKLFRGRSVRRLSEWRELFQQEEGRAILQAFYDEAVRRGLFPENPDRVRKRYAGWGCLLTVFGVLVLLLANMYLARWVAAVWCLGFALLGVAALVQVVGRAMPRKTRSGAQEARKWQAFRRYLVTLSQMPVERAQELLERYLPYAVALGVERPFLKALMQWQTHTRRYVTPPRWYRVPHDDDHWEATTPSGSHRDVRAEPRGTMPSLSDASERMGAGLSRLSLSLGSMLSAAATAFTASSSDSDDFSGGGSVGGGGGGGGGIEFD